MRGKHRDPLDHADPNLLELIVETIPDGVLLTRATDGEIVKVNDGFEKLFGHTKDESIGRTTTELQIWAQPRDRERFLADLASRGSVNDFIAQFRHKDGHGLSVVVYATYLTSNGERFILGVNRNIDQFASLGRDLGDSRARYSELVELLPAVLFECNDELKIDFMNAAGLTIFGSPMETGNQLRLSDIVVPPSDIDLNSWAQQARRSGMHARLEVEARRIDDTSFPGLLTLLSISGRPGRSGYLGILVNITDQKRSQERLSKLSQAVEQSPSLVLITDKAGHIEYINPSFTRLTGFTLEEVQGRTPRILKSGAVPEETYRSMWNTILSGREWRTEILNRKKNGETYWQRSTISPIYDEHGDITHFLEVAEDITRERELESELFQSQKMEAIGHLAGGIAHDFNNMLTVIMGVGEILHDRVQDSEELHGYTESILSAARKSASLTHQLLAFSRKQLLHPEQLDVNVVIRDADKLLRRIVGDNIRITTDLARNLGTALLDQSQLNQIILNLVVNAREAIVGSGSITISTNRFETDRELLLSSGKLPAGSYVVLSITDNGAGMDEETVAHIFEPFFTTKSSGTGLGLATVYGIVQQSDGQIDVKSAASVGTTFTLYFPLTSDRSTGAAQVAVPGQRLRGNEAILVVEDNSAVRTFVREVLVDHGYSVLLADSAEKAVEEWPGLRAGVDLLLTDVVLPQQDGVHLYAILRETRPDLPVVYMSGYTEDSSSILQEMAEGKMLLSKPFGADQLASAVRRALDSQSKH